jgi:hypothetical protein
MGANIIKRVAMGVDIVLKLYLVYLKITTGITMGITQ